MPCRTTSWHTTSRVVEKSMFSSNRFTSAESKTISWFSKLGVSLQTFRVSFWHPKTAYKTLTKHMLHGVEIWIYSTWYCHWRQCQVIVSDFYHVLQENTQWQLRHLLSHVRSQINNLRSRKYWSRYSCSPQVQFRVTGRALWKQLCGFPPQ